MMRKVLMALLALGGAIGAAQQAHAGPALDSAAVPDQPAQVQSVQYYDDWRYRQFRRREAFEDRQRFREFRRHQLQRHGYDRGYDRRFDRGFGRGGVDPRFGYYGPRY